MIKFLYYAYAGIRSLRPDLPFNKANESSAIAPPPAKMMHLPSITDHHIWLDDIYLNLHIPAASISSRFTESEDITRRIHPSTPMIQCNSPSGSHTPRLGQMHRTVATINRILFLPSKTEHPRSTHPAVTFIWRMLHTIFMVDLTAWPPPPNDPRTKKKILHEVCPTHSHRQETSPASRSSKLIVFADDSASTFHIPSTELKLHDIVRICLHHHHIEEDELEALNQEKKDCLLVKIQIPTHLQIPVPPQDPIHWRNPAKTRLAKSNPPVNPVDAPNCTPTECPSNKPSSNTSKKTRPPQITSIRDTQLGPQDPIPAPTQTQIPN